MTVPLSLCVHWQKRSLWPWRILRAFANSCTSMLCVKRLRHGGCQLKFGDSCCDLSTEQNFTDPELECVCQICKRRSFLAGSFNCLSPFVGLAEHRHIGNSAKRISFARKTTKLVVLLFALSMGLILSARCSTSTFGAEPNQGLPDIMRLDMQKVGLALKPYYSNRCLEHGFVSWAFRLSPPSSMLPMHFHLCRTMCAKRICSPLSVSRTFNYSGSAFVIQQWSFRLRMVMLFYNPDQETFKATPVLETFLESYHPLVDAWHEMLTNESVDFSLLATSPFSEQPVDIAMSTFADDLCRKTIVSCPQDAESKVDALNNCLDHALLPAGMAQNTSKQEHVVVFSGARSKAYTKQLLSEQKLTGKTLCEARYLGAVCRYDGNPSSEIGKRARAAYSAWSTFRGVWHSRELPWRAVRCIFISMVYNVLFSGLETLCLGAVHYKKLDSIVISYGRRLMHGKACTKIQQEDGSTKYVSKSNLEVFRYLGLASSRIELRIRRLQFLQQMARNADAHVAVLTAIFGKLCFDKEDTLCPAGGGLAEHANVYAKMFWNDLQSLALLDSGYWVLEAAGADIHSLFAHLAPDFCAVDVTELRARELSHAVPPWDSLRDESDAVGDMADDDHDAQPNFTCEVVLADGNLCGQGFRRFSDLRVHQRLSRISGHGNVPDYVKASHVNQCPWCHVVHASIEGTKQHVRFRLEKGTCPRAYGSATVLQPTLPHDYVCKFCGEECLDLAHLHAHIRSHFSS